MVASSIVAVSVDIGTDYLAPTRDIHALSIASNEYSFFLALRIASCIE